MLPRPATLVTAVIVTFTIAGVMKLSTRSATRGDDRRPESDSRDTVSSARIDSGRYEREITALESALYNEAPPSTIDFMTIAAAFQDVGFAIADREVNASSRDVAGDVALLASQADVGEAGYSLPDIARLRSDWERLRSERFVDTEWFRESTAALDEAQVVSAPAIDPAVVDDLLHGIDALEALSEEGRRACDELGEPFYDFERPGPAGEAHIATWNEFAREWEDQVSRVASQLPSPPTWDADPDVVASYQDLTGAMRELRNATMGGGAWPVPQEGEWAAHFDEANRLLEQARTRLSARSSSD